MIITTVCLGVILAGCTSNNKSLESNEKSQAGSETLSQSTTNESSIKTTDKANLSEIKVTVEEAIKAYEEAYPNTAITSLDLDTSFGSYYYEIQGVDDSKEYEVKINAATAKLTKEREETLDREEQNGVEKENKALDLKGLKSLEEASKIAQESAGQGEAVEWSLDRELSITYWEVKVRSGNDEISIKIDAQTGEVIEKEIED
ncbi:PepSY domain-containing protein [Enterococcus silesiacus]|nr:PepSY domain-containing protein [Enterococcus silesiacus]